MITKNRKLLLILSTFKYQSLKDVEEKGVRKKKLLSLFYFSMRWKQNFRVKMDDMLTGKKSVEMLSNREYMCM